MSAHEDGGPAFPVPGPTELPSNGIITDAYGGMTLRDYFAAHAITTMIYKSEDCDGGWSPDTVAAGCYALADAMLAARKAGSE